jgi:5-methylcytosine-specific restriction endonuclease McrA
LDWDDEPDMQLCRICREEKFIEDFQSDGKGGRRTECRICCNLQRVRWAHSTPERHRRALAMREAYVKRRKRAPGGHTEAEWQARLQAYGARCAYCGRSDRALVKEHVIPLSAGGSNDISNLVPACQSCNARKLDRLDIAPAPPTFEPNGSGEASIPATMGVNGLATTIGRLTESRPSPELREEG